MAASETKVAFEGGTREREKGGQHAATQSAEKHDSPRAKGKRVQVPSSPSKCVAAATDLTLEDSKVSGIKRREIGPAEAVRRANNHARDSRTVQGTCKPSEITTD